MPDKMHANHSRISKKFAILFLLLPVPSFLLDAVAMNSRSVSRVLAETPETDGGHGGSLLAGSAVLVYMNIFVGQ